MEVVNNLAIRGMILVLKRRCELLGFNKIIKEFEMIFYFTLLYIFETLNQEPSSVRVVTNAMRRN